MLSWGLIRHLHKNLMFHISMLSILRFSSLLSVSRLLVQIMVPVLHTSFNFQFHRRLKIQGQGSREKCVSKVVSNPSIPIYKPTVMW